MADQERSVTPPAFLDGAVRPFHVRDRDLLVVAPHADWRYDDAARWADELVKMVADDLGWTIRAVVLPPGTGLHQYHDAEEDDRG